MNILLDTSTFLHMTMEPHKLTKKACDLIEDPATELFLSAVSAGEIGLKYTLRKLPLPKPPSQFVPEQRTINAIQTLPLHESSTLLLPSLPLHHRDPFDRMLICQALEHGMTILTGDRQISQYDVETVW